MQGNDSASNSNSSNSTSAEEASASANNTRNAIYNCNVTNFVYN